MGTIRADAEMNGQLFDTVNRSAEGVDLAVELLTFAGRQKFATVLADPPWRFANRTGKMAPEHKRLSRYRTLAVEEIAALPVKEIVSPTGHLYLWVPNALFALRAYVASSVGI